MQYFPHRFFDPSSHILQFVSALVLRRATGGGGGGGGGAASLPVVVPHVEFHEKKQMCF